jgi:hypothetical protein
MTIFRMSDDAQAVADKEARGTDDRRTDDRLSGGRVDFVRVNGIGIDVRALVRVPPKQPIVLDEMKVAPSKQWQKQDVKRQAKQVLDRVKSGRGFNEAEVTRLQQRLMSMERQEELVGRESEGRKLATELGELRRSRLESDVKDVVARYREGRFSEADVTKLQQRLQSLERQDELLGRESQGQEMAATLGELKRSKLVGEALNVVAGAKEGRRYSEARLIKLQQKLLGMERQDELFGQDSEGMRLALELAEVRRSNVVSEASDVLARAKQGRQFPRNYVAKLQERLLGMERQDELFGRASEGRQLATALGEVRRSNLVSEALGVLKQVKEGQKFDPAYVKKLQGLLLSMQRQDELAGKPSDGMQLAAELGKVRR